MITTLDNASEREGFMDNTAKGAGLWAMTCAAFGNFLALPQDSILYWLIGLMITGLFGIASSAVAVYVKWRLDRREKKSKDSIGDKRSSG